MFEKCQETDNYSAVVPSDEKTRGKKKTYLFYGSPTHETAFALRTQRVPLCTLRALNAARSAV
jgi:hypothetical protein